MARSPGARVYVIAEAGVPAGVFNLVSGRGVPVDSRLVRCPCRHDATGASAYPSTCVALGDHS